MKMFESFLAEHIEAFIKHRKDLGYVNTGLRSLLFSFDRYVRKNGNQWSSLQPSFFLDFREQLQGEPQAINGLIQAVRNFFNFLVRIGYCQSNPLQDLPYKKERAFVPFLFAPEDIERLLQAIEQKIRKTEPHFLTDLGVYTAILLQARCGLRISEPLRLLYDHYDPRHGTLSIEKTKFHKDRLLPLPHDAQVALNNYLSVRGDSRKDTPYLLAGPRKGLRNMQIYNAFHQAVREIGLQSPRRVIGNTVFGRPTPHCLRHAFAVNTLKAIRAKGKDPQKALPVLAAYMGHTKYRYTAVYLKVLDAEHRKGFADFALSHQEEL